MLDDCHMPLTGFTISLKRVRLDRNLEQCFKVKDCIKPRINQLQGREAESFIVKVEILDRQLAHQSSKKICRMQKISSLQVTNMIPNPQDSDVSNHCLRL